MWNIVGYIWAFILGFIGICIALPIIITLITYVGYVLFWAIIALIAIIVGIFDSDTKYIK